MISISKIALLDGTNWGIWKPRMKDILYLNDLHDPIEGDEKKPSDVDEGDWKKMDKKAIALIRQYLNDSVFHHVASCESAKALWDKLVSLYESKSATSKAFLVRKLVQLRLDEEKSVAEHLNEFQDVINQLANMKVNFDDELQALLLMSSLSESWETLVVSLSNSNANGTISLETVRSSLLNEELRRKGSGLKSVQSEAMVARDSKGDTAWKKKEASGKGAIICHYCNKKGHIRRNCHAYKKDQKRAAHGDSSDDAGADFAEGTYSEASCDVLFSEGKPWKMDSGASFHICRDVNCFASYEKSVDMIRTANGEELPVCGIGSIRFRMHDGVVREVSGVRHVPTCSHNLISLGQLDRRGCTYETQGGVLRVKKGGRVRMRGILEEGNLYRLVGHVVDYGRRVTFEEPSSQQGGEVNVVTAYDSSRIENHVSDRGLHVDDARGIDSDHGASSDRVIDGCRVEKSTRTRWRSLWYYKRF